MAWTRKLPSGRHQGLYRDAGGRVQSTGTFARKGDARDAADDQESRMRRGVWVDPELRRTLFADYARHYMAVTLNQDVSTKTRDDSLLRNHLLPAFGTMTLPSLATADVRLFVAELSQKLSPSTVALCYQLLGRIMRNAEEDGLIVKSPATANIKLPRQTRLKRADRWLTIGELELLAECITPRFRAAVLVMGYMGLRFGESRRSQARASRPAPRHA